MVPPLKRTRPVMVMLLNLLQLSAKNLFIHFHILSTLLELFKHCVPNPPQNRAPKPSLLVSDDIVEVLLNKLIWSNRILNLFLKIVFFFPKDPVLHPRLISKSTLWLPAQLCCIVFLKRFFVSCVLISHLKFSYRVDCKLIIQERIWWLWCIHEF